jgi:hypothetical protein
VSIYRWVQQFAPDFAEAARARQHVFGDRWHVDETYLKVGGTWRYLFRAIDQFGPTPRASGDDAPSRSAARILVLFASVNLLAASTSSPIMSLTSPSDIVLVGWYEQPTELQCRQRGGAVQLLDQPEPSAKKRVPPFREGFEACGHVRD